MVKQGLTFRAVVQRLIDELRLLAGSIVASAIWVGLTVATVGLIVAPLSYPAEDYAGYTLLTMFWCWVVALQMPWMLNKRIRPETEP